MRDIRAFLSNRSFARIVSIVAKFCSLDWKLFSKVVISTTDKNQPKMRLSLYLWCEPEEINTNSHIVAQETEELNHFYEENRFMADAKET